MWTVDRFVQRDKRSREGNGVEGMQQQQQQPGHVKWDLIAFAKIRTTAQSN